MLWFIDAMFADLVPSPPDWATSTLDRKISGNLVRYGNVTVGTLGKVQIRGLDVEPWCCAVSC